MKFKKAVKLMQEGKFLSSSIMDDQKEYVYYDPKLETFAYSYADSDIYTTYVFDIEDILNRNWTLYKGAL